MKTHIRHIGICLLLLLAHLFPASLSAQARNFYSTESGLSSSLINLIFQDSQGYIWVATEYGLNRFDGLNFSTYRHVAGDPASLPSDYVRTLFEDSRQHLLVGCINGLTMYDRETDTFREIPMTRGGKCVSPHVTHFQESKRGEVWLSTSGQGLFCLDKSLTEARSADDLFPQVDCAYQSQFCIDSRSDIWIGTEGNGLARYDSEKQEVQFFTYPTYRTDNVTSIAEDTEGNIIVGTQKHGLMRYDSVRRQLVPISTEKDGLLSVYCMAMVSGRLLVGTDGQGLKVYDSQTRQIEGCKLNSASVDLSKAKVHSVMEDRDGNLWLGLFQRGIALIPKQENPFEYHGRNSIDSNPIGEGCVMYVYQDSDRHLWVSADNEGLYELDADCKRLHHYAPGERGEYIPGTVMCIFEDSERNLWIGSFGQGVAKRNKATGRWEQFGGIDGSIVYSIAEDKNQNLYVGTFGSGFYQYNLKSKEVVHYESSKDEKNDLNRNELANDWINCIFCDREGLVWLGHYKGVSCFDPKTGSFLNSQNINSLITDCIGYVFAEDRNGNIWAGTSDGLYCYAKQTGTLRRFTTDDGLPNNVVCGICEDREGNIWVSTYKGISKHDVRKATFVNYYSGDGLQGNEFTHGACHKGADGKIYFGGINGLTSFRPESIRTDAKKLKVCITDFYVYNQRIQKNTLSGGAPIIYTAVQDANVFCLSHEDNTFSIAFSTLQYNNPEQIVYQYKMDELGSQWAVTEEGVNRVTYNNLRPGKYTFRVRAINHGICSEVRTVKVVIASPWYKRWWAYCLYGGLFVLLVIGVVHSLRSRVRYRRELMKREHAEQLNEAKLQFFINISHEIRTPMTLIISPLEKLLAEDEAGGALHKTHLMIYRNAQRILRLINQLMDIRKLDKGQMSMKMSETDMVGFIADAMQPFEYTAQKKHIAFSFSHAQPQLMAWIDLNNFDKVLMNVLSNAFKYTPEEGEIEITLSVGMDETRMDALRNYFEIVVTDSGIGIDKDKVERIFERFYQIDNDVTQSNFGTGIGLHLSRLLVALHHGTIRAENRTDRTGSRFIIRIPLGASHLKADELENSKKRPLAETNAHPGIPPKPATGGDVPSADTPETVSARARGPRLLVAEDDEEIREYLKAELSDEYKVDVCCNGKEAYDRILKDMPALVISDVMMPEMDGLILCHKMKQNTNVNHIPIILLTAKARTEDNVEGMDMGADAYVTKPFSTEVLKSTIANLLANRRLLRNKFSGAQQQEKRMEKVSVKSGDEELMDRIMKVVNQNLDNPELNVEMLASAVGLSRVHIHRKLKEITNLSTRDFIRNIRLQQAATLLRQNKKMTVSDVAYAVGYTNLSHFSNSFKEQYGVSPKEFMSEN